MKQIIALGGGGFSMEPENPLLDDYIVGASGKVNPRICFLPTASFDSDDYVARFHAAMKRYTNRASHLKIDADPLGSTRDQLMTQDVIFVGGGNTMHMLRIWHEHGVDRVLKEAYETGVLLSGLSAGSICWFDWGLTDSIPGKMTPIKCLGFLSGGNCVHYDGEPERRPAFQREIARGWDAGLATDDGVALHYQDGRLLRIVSSHPEARAYKVEARGNIPHELELIPDYINRPGPIIRRAAARDVAGIHAAHHASIQTLAARDYTPEQIAAWTSRILDEPWAAEIAHRIKTESIWVLEMEGKVEGFVHLRSPQDLAPSAYLHALYVTPKAAGRGLAKQLMSVAEGAAVERGHSSMKLHSSITALKFYKRLGYEQVGESQVHHVAGTSLPCFPLAKALASVSKK